MWCLALTIGTPCAQGAANEVETQPSNHELHSAYTGGYWRNLDGGVRTGGAYLDNLSVRFAVDLERAFAVPNVNVFAHVQRNSGRFSDRYVGDAMAVSNIEAPGELRILEAWAQWTGGATDNWSVLFGLYDLNSQFDVSSSRSLFLHSTHGVGHELAQTGLNGPSIYPMTSLALRLSWQPDERWRLLAALMDGVPGSKADPTRSGVHWSSEEGILGIAELQWLGTRVTQVAVGYWSYSADFEDLRSTPQAQRPPRDDNWGVYGSVEVALGRDTSEPDRTLAFARYGIANGYINEFKDYLGIGLRRRLGWTVGGGDEVGVALSISRLSDVQRAFEGMQRDRYESSIEFTYRLPLTDWLVVQPDLQFIVNPGAQRELKDSWVVGMMFEVEWRRAW